MNHLPKTQFHILLLILWIFACSENEPEVIGLNNQEAAEDVSSILISDVSGVAGDVRLLSNSAIFNSGAGRTECGVLFDTLINLNYEGPNVQFDLEFSYNYGLNCSNNIPEELTLDFSSESNYEGPRLARNGNSSGELTAGVAGSGR